jgi:hypothetical protein
MAKLTPTDLNVGVPEGVVEVLQRAAALYYEAGQELGSELWEALSEILSEAAGNAQRLLDA